MFALAAACRARGADYFAISGYRSFDDQAALYEQGRTTPGKIVTKAKAGYSAHNYGIAIDWCFDADVARKGLQPEWGLDRYVVLAEEAERLGLEAALRWKSFKEGPHIQLPITSRHISLTMLKGRYEKTGRLESAWHLLDANGPWFSP